METFSCSLCPPPFQLKKWGKTPFKKEMNGAGGSLQGHLSWGLPTMGAQVGSGRQGENEAAFLRDPAASAGKGAAGERKKGNMGA